MGTVNATLNVTNCTIANNQSNFGGGGILALGHEDDNNGPVVSLNFVTIVANQATGGVPGADSTGNM